MNDFFNWYQKKKDIKAMEDYITNSDDFKMDCRPIPLVQKDSKKIED